MLLNMTTKKTRKTHTAEFKAEALKLAERVGVAEAARQLKIYESQLYNWRSAIEKKIDNQPTRSRACCGSRQVKTPVS